MKNALYEEINRLKKINGELAEALLLTRPVLQQVCKDDVNNLAARNCLTAIKKAVTP